MPSVSDVDIRTRLVYRAYLHVLDNIGVLKTGKKFRLSHELLGIRNFLWIELFQTKEPAVYPA